MGKGYCEILVSLSILFVQPYVHTIKFDHSTQVIVKAVTYWNHFGDNQISHNESQFPTKRQFYIENITQATVD